MTLDITVPRTIGSAGQVGPLAFGCWRFVGHQVDDAAALIETALDLGMNLIDTADVYGLDWGGTAFGQAEELLGAVLAARPGLRSRMVLATKGGIWPGRPYDSSRSYLVRALDASLRRLGVERVDLYQVHRPDLFTHPAELASVLDGFVDSGKVGAIGVSNYSPSQIEALSAHLRHPLATSQPQFSIGHLDPIWDGSLDQCMSRGITPLAWSPLAGGRVVTGEGLRTDLGMELDRLADRNGVDRSAVALAFVLAHPSRPIAILGTQNPERLRSATGALSVRLDRADVYRLIEVSTGQSLP